MRGTSRPTRGNQGRGRNLGNFDTRAAAKKHEQEIQHFKHKG